MPSKGGSRTTNQTRTSATTIAPVAGPAVVVRSPTQAIFEEAEAIRAVVGAPVAGGVTGSPPPPEAGPAIAFTLDLEDPSVGTPEWADLYARSVERHRDERERIDREQLEAQQLWEEFLAAQGSDVPEGERGGSARHRPWRGTRTPGLMPPTWSSIPPEWPSRRATRRQP